MLPMIVKAVSRIDDLAGHVQEGVDVTGVDGVQSPWARPVISSANTRSKKSTHWKAEPANELRMRVELIQEWRKV